MRLVLFHLDVSRLNPLDFAAPGQDRLVHPLVHLLDVLLKRASTQLLEKRLLADLLATVPRPGKPVRPNSFRVALPPITDSLSSSSNAYVSGMKEALGMKGNDLNKVRPS